ncbi:MAG: 50S ribosomal protein L22 [Candidatus Uhrbacteria bacterium]|nr:50S ribosomal protein L22 [Patescibacteria group bacterium]
MEVKASAKFIRMSPRKVRLVVDVVRGLPVAKAQAQLKFMNKAAARPVLKLINSAVANAEHNFNLKAENLVVKTITADGGPTLHRWKPRAHGRASAIRKRTSHINVVLDELEAKKVPPTKDVAGSRHEKAGGKTKPKADTKKSTK